ncbi:hypothetical protein BGX38DRAFT_1204573 [Terfezia claveryi]|nr:hypothetical protein BGX38DRAFT_1204573 [Terfezia claveryi]
MPPLAVEWGNPLCFLILSPLRYTSSAALAGVEGEGVFLSLLVYPSLFSASVAAMPVAGIAIVCGCPRPPPPPAIVECPHVSKR